MRGGSEQQGRRQGPTPSSPHLRLSRAGEAGLRAATSELHQLLLDAADYVMLHQRAVAPFFALPDALWPLLRHSWYRQRADLVLGRFDFAVTDSGLKLHGYKAGGAAASALPLECGVRDHNSLLFEQLVVVWRAKKVLVCLFFIPSDAPEHLPLLPVTAAHAVHAGLLGYCLTSELFMVMVLLQVSGPLHILLSEEHTGEEEEYRENYAKMVMAAAEAAGVICKLVLRTASWSFDAGGRVLDAEGMPFANVWSATPWHAVIYGMADLHINAYVQQHEAARGNGPVPIGSLPAQGQGVAPNLGHVLLDARTRVFDPLWTLLPGCLAILPVLWDIKPDHPYLLR